LYSIIILLFVVFSAVILPQKTDKESIPAKDSVSAFRGLNLEQNIPFKNEFNSFQPGYLFNNSFSNLNIDSTSTWLATKTFFNQPGYSSFSSENVSRDMLKPLRIQYEGEKNVSLLRYVLGIAQTGTVGYLLYKRIKKYGLK